jgi:magnesium transporter
LKNLASSGITQGARDALMTFSLVARACARGVIFEFFWPGGDTMPVNMTQVEMLRKLLRHGATERVVRITSKFRPAEIADVFGMLSPAEQRQFVDVLFDHGNLADILLELPEGILEELMDRISDERLTSLLNDMATDDAVFVLTLLDDERVEPILRAVEPIHRERIERSRSLSSMCM